MTGDKNLLFGVLAVQLRGLSPQSLVEAGALWAVSPSRSLSEILLERGALKEADCAILARLVDDAIEAAGGDVEAAISGLGLESGVSAILAAGGPDSAEAAAFATQLGLSGGVAVTEGAIAALHEEPGRYASDREFSRGGMGRILLVHDGYLERDVALKELLPLAADTDATMAHDSPKYGSSEVMARFLREAKVTAQLEHPGIVPVYEVGRRRNGVLYYTMRLVQGQTLSQKIAGSADLEARLRLMNPFLDLCQAISYAHSRGVIHRDIKPANVMIGRFGETVVIDWGLAKVRGKDDPYVEQLREGLTLNSSINDSESLRTQHGARLGTPHYMSPEQAEGRIEAIDERSDVFALGSVLYEVLTGQKAFAGKSVHAILSKVIHDDPAPIRTLEPHIPPELAGICEKAMRKRPADRYRSAAELAEDIARYQAGALVQAYRYSTTEVLWRYYRRNRALVHTAAAGVCLLAALGVYSYIAIAQAYEREYGQRLSAQAAQEAEAEARGVAERAAAEEAIARALAEEKSYLAQIRLAEWYLDERRFSEAQELLWAAPPERRGWEWGHLLLKASNERLIVNDAAMAIWSPDGERLAVSQRDALPHIVSAADGLVTGRLQPPGREAGGPVTGPLRYSHLAYSPDGRFIAGVTIAGELTVWDAARLEATAHRRLSEESGGSTTARGLSYSADGALAAAVHSQGITVLTTDTWGPFATIAADATAADFTPDGKGLVATLREGRVLVWDTTAKRERYVAAGSAPIIHPGRNELGVLEGGVLVFRRLDSDRIIHTVTPPPGPPPPCWAWSPADGATVAYAQGGEVSVAAYATGDALVRGRHGSDVTALRFSADGAFVAALGVADSSVSVWDAHTGAPLAQYVLPLPGGARDLSFHPHTAEILAMSATPEVQRGVVRPAARSLDTWTAAYPIRISDRLDADRERAVFSSGSSGQVTSVFDRRTAEGYRIATGGGQTGPADLAPDGGRAVLTLDGYTCGVWNLADKRIAGVFAEHERSVDAVSFSPDGRQVASADAAGTVYVWDASSMAISARLSIAEEPGGLYIAFAPDGEHLIVSCRKTGLSEWHIGRGERTGRFETGNASSGSLFVTDSSPALVVTRNEGGSIAAWDWTSGQPVSALPALAGGVFRYVPAPEMSRAFAAIAAGMAVLDESGMNHITTLGDSAWRASRSIVPVGEREVWVVDSAGRVAALRSLPAELPLRTVTQEAFMAWRRRELAEGTPAKTALTDEMYAIQTTEWWERIARALAGYHAGAVLDPHGEAALTALSTTLGLLEDERILGVAVRPEGRMEATIGRAGRTFSAHIAPIAPIERSLEVSLRIPEAIALLESQLDLLDTGGDGLSAANRREAAKRGIHLADDADLDGLIVPGGAGSAAEGQLRAARLCGGDRIVAIDGQAIDSLATARRLCGEILSGLRAGTPVTVAYTVERGAYQLIRLRYVVE